MRHLKRAGKPVGAWLLPGLLLLALGAARCAPAPSVWKPILEETSTISLRTETQKAADHVARARALLGSEPAATAVELAGAENSLRHLLVYYLPLVDARELSYNAYRHLYLGEGKRAADELDKVEKILLETSRSGRHLERELQRSLAAAAAAKAGLEGGAEDAPARLAKLATELNFLVVKGGLILQTDSH